MPKDLDGVEHVEWKQVSDANNGAAPLAARSTLEQSYRRTPRPGEVAIRPFPFPYRAGLAISNDCDSMSVKSFWDWHGYVNGSAMTPYGQGLGLEVGDSFWPYAGDVLEGMEPALYFGNPYDDHVKPYPKWAKCLELAKLGWFDTLHSFGNWRVHQRPDLTSRRGRDQIERALDRMNKLGYRPRVLTNHSGSPSNLGVLWGYYQKSDDPSDSLYCYDLLKSFGFRYFWIDPCIQFEKFGEGLDYFDDAALKRAVRAYDFGPWLRRRVDGVTALIEMPHEADKLRDWLMMFFNRLIMPLPSGDGSPILAFKRHRGVDQPVESTFPVQVTERNLDDLQLRGGAVVIYQHFAIQGPLGRAPIFSKQHRLYSPSPALSTDSVHRFASIAERNRDGQLFVATVSRLLDWVHLSEHVKLSVEKGADRWVVTVAGVDCPAYGYRPVEARDLNGFSLLVPKQAPDVVVEISGRTLPLDLKRVADPVHDGFDVLYAPWQKLEWPDDLRPYGVSHLARGRGAVAAKI